MRGLSRPVPEKLAAELVTALVGRGGQSTTCCRSIRGCSFAWASANEHRTTSGNRFVYYPGSAPQFHYTAVDVKTARTRSPPRLRFPKVAPRACCSRRSSWFAGYSLYVKDRRLRYAQLSRARRVPHRRDGTAHRPADPCASTLHATGRALRARSALRRRAAGGRATSAHGAACDRDVGRGLCCGYEPAGCPDARLPCAVPLHGAASTRSWYQVGDAPRRTAKRSCAPR